MINNYNRLKFQRNKTILYSALVEIAQPHNLRITLTKTWHWKRSTHWASLRFPSRNFSHLFWFPLARPDRGGCGMRPLLRSHEFPTTFSVRLIKVDRLRQNHLLHNTSYILSLTITILFGFSIYLPLLLFNGFVYFFIRNNIFSSNLFTLLCSFRYVRDKYTNIHTCVKSILFKRDLKYF